MHVTTDFIAKMAVRPQTFKKELDTKMLEEITLGFVSGVFCERLPFPNCLFLPSLLGASVGAGAEWGCWGIYSF